LGGKQEMEGEEGREKGCKAVVGRPRKVSAEAFQ